MVDSQHSAKICPLFAAFAANKDQVSTGSTWATRCKGADCAWWDDSHSICGIVLVSKELAKALASGTTE